MKGGNGEYYGGHHGAPSRHVAMKMMTRGAMLIGAAAFALLTAANRNNHNHDEECHCKENHGKGRHGHCCN